MDSRIDSRAEVKHSNQLSPDKHIDATPASRAEPLMVSLTRLVLDSSPRLSGEDVSHTRVLAEAGTALPPILVHGETMRVVDGMHRVQAARLRGETEIRAIYFYGDENAAFVKSVEANVTHGLPLSAADRRVAAARIITSYPDWSDRAVAVAAGISHKTARAIRERIISPLDQVTARIGRDGKVRPLSTAETRQRAAVLIAERPGASLRQIASAAGVSLATARDVRQRVRNGESPVPLGVRRTGQRETPRSLPTAGTQAVRQLHNVAADTELVTPSSLLQRLKDDPSLRYSENGRLLLRWLDSHIIDAADWARALEGVPPHCTYTLAELAARCAKVWERLAEEMRVRGQQAEPGGTN